ncbi:arginine-tRNA ligase cytoplasmic-like, partial [Trifolium medium]|nr:arginine-tRNA ligase cytoplasmic-like [Trifolium medium]
YRLNVEKLDCNIYVIDVGQWQHFDMLFKAFRRTGWLPKDANEYPIDTHISFGLVLSDDENDFGVAAAKMLWSHFHLCGVTLSLL